VTLLDQYCVWNEKWCTLPAVSHKQIAKATLKKPSEQNRPDVEHGAGTNRSSDVAYESIKVFVQLVWR
jgi:hypothetical protein